MKRCPKCGNDIFYVTAHVTQGWIVDDGGEYLATTEECEEVTHKPDDFDMWQCTNCDYLDSGKAFNVKEEGTV